MLKFITIISIITTVLAAPCSEHYNTPGLEFYQGEPANGNKINYSEKLPTDYNFESGNYNGLVSSLINGIIGREAADNLLGSSNKDNFSLVGTLSRVNPSTFGQNF